jgi:hypothetical protein
VPKNESAAIKLTKAPADIATIGKRLHNQGAI